MSQTPIGPGSVLAGRYRLEDLLEEAPAAKFWRATDEILARSVAVHVVSADDPRADSLLVAARTSATVSDGHFLRVLDCAEQEDVVYVVNEWGSGLSLDHILADGPLPPRRAAWVVKEVAEAVTTAHRSGIAHGRLLPENVMVSEAGAVKLIGFVVDAVLHLPPGASPDGAPDQADDVVNLAALLYATLVGKWPGSAGSSLPPAPSEHGRCLRPRQVRAGIPRALDTICDRVLNVDAHPNELPLQSAHEIAAALSDFIGDPTGSGQAGYETTSMLQVQEIEKGPGSQAAPDPEATQAGVPVFLDRVDERRPAPPPPDLPEPETRPLFAPDPPGGRVRPAPEDPSRAHGYTTGHGTGSLPAVWGPDTPPDAEEDTGWDVGDSGKNWLQLAGIVALCVVLAIGAIIAFSLTRGDDGTATPAGETPSADSSPAHVPVHIAGVQDFDPQGDPPEENGDLAPLAIDGDPSTAWKTVTYFGNPKLGGLKDGVGLVVDLGKPVAVSQVRLTLVGAPTSLEVLAAKDRSAAPTSTDGLTKVAAKTDAGTKVDLPLKPVPKTRYLVVWLTSLPPASGGYQGQIAEIAVRS